jgi:hypothetical protein
MIPRHFLAAVAAKRPAAPSAGVANRFWRMEFAETQDGPSAPASGNYAGISKTELADTPSGPDLIDRSLYLTRSLGSTTEGGESFVNAFRAGTPGQYNAVVRKGTFLLPWIGWDFLATTDVQEFRISPRAGYHGQLPQVINFQSSPDGSAWQTVWSRGITTDPTFVWFPNKLHTFTKGWVKPAVPPRDAPHKFWQLRAMTYWDNSYWTVSSGKFYPTAAMATPHASPPNANILGSNIVESAAWAAFSNADYAVNGAGYRQSYRLEFPTPVEVRAFTMKSRNGYGGQGAKIMAFDYSDDGINYYPAWQVDTPAWGNDEFRTFVDPAFA